MLADVNYDALSRRQRVSYGNGRFTEYISSQSPFPIRRLNGPHALVQSAIFMRVQLGWDPIERKPLSTEIFVIRVSEVQTGPRPICIDPLTPG